jgi:hypothetical protein
MRDEDGSAGAKKPKSLRESLSQRGKCGATQKQDHRLELRSKESIQKVWASDVKHLDI